MKADVSARTYVYFNIVSHLFEINCYLSGILTYDFTGWIFKVWKPIKNDKLLKQLMVQNIFS